MPGKALALVRTAKPTTPSQAAFAARVQAVMQEHGDIAAEACWQELARVVVQEWASLSNDQPPIATWSMITRCTETVLKVRKVAQQDKEAGGQEALEEFRRFMESVITEDDAPTP